MSAYDDTKTRDMKGSATRRWLLGSAWTTRGATDSHSSFGPHFTAQSRVQPHLGAKYDLVCDRVPRRRSHTYRPRPGKKNASKYEERTRCGLGVLQKRREPPENWTGGEQNKSTELGPLTMSAFNLPQLTQIHSKIFFTLIIKPVQGLAYAQERVIRTHQDETPAVLIQYDRSGQDTPPFLHHTSDT